MASADPYRNDRNQFSPPPGQGHYPAIPDNASSYDPRRSSVQQDTRPPRGSFDASYNPRFGPERRPYAPSEPRPHDGNIMTPYDDEKAYAQYNDAYGPPGASSQASTYDQPRSRSRIPPPPSDAELGYTPKSRRGDGYRDRSRGPESDQTSYYSPSRNDREYSRRDSRGPAYDDRDRDGYYDRASPSSPTRQRHAQPESKRDIFRQGLEGNERGLASAALGAAAGAFLGHKAGRGTLGTLSGLAVGAIGASALEKQATEFMDKRKQREEGGRDLGRDRSRDDGWDYSRDGRRAYSPDYGRDRSRDRSYDSRYQSPMMSGGRSRDYSPDSRAGYDDRARSRDDRPRRRYSRSPSGYTDDRQ